MPCNDITDLLKLELDADERISSYRLSKRTCGAAVGGYSLLQDWMQGKLAEEVLAMPADVFLEELPPQDETYEFLYLKHFFSIQNALEVMLGSASGKREDKCIIESIEHGPEGYTFTSSIKVEIVAKQIKACAGCKSGCGTRSQVS
ncbi:MAG: hypothetical protein COX62_03090 [Deltaproteobacteria bacterium CG_4_10_14_0_2_um_filter_43_8]|nr:MAG: hypothetical protein COV43_09185 [Deltaproteobacteria bacterium CG11_big_fil_rev_8_21_14_0_20_42_23]PJA21192.1 MAG: hypothetical protein COX62_03090 [Deltaproteobacteria bacterium CG_4_10_14_0_2_um_filter_43_8]PJC64802.1 MAG: hypothetical protein CO021_02460 [Deltaproteobacteria bacterium CG_4_9_14_0_2_um_filter_42_21]